MESTIPDFTNFKYEIAIPPATTRILAWAKLQECERRLAFYRWCEELNDPGTAQHRTLLNDALSAFLWTHEATIQFLYDQFQRTPGSPSFWLWLEKRPAFDFRLRGLRALRHFEAHIEPRKARRLVKLKLGEAVSCTWHLPTLSKNELAKLKSKPIKPRQITYWNKLVTTTPAPDIFKLCLDRLQKVLLAAESVL